MRHTCTRNHKFVSPRFNYITKEEQCGRHHCNAPLKPVVRTKAELLMTNVEKQIEAVLGDATDVEEFWEYKGHRIYAALYDLTKYARQLEKDNEIRK